MKQPDITKANETELLTIIYHDPFASLDDIYHAKQQLAKLRPAEQHYPKLQQIIKPAYPR
ncbi:hypothetical protein BK133_10965 [Paenibacillus sp. FSL H8-0548]|uniref:hypothetical protein n=1 Tax=Paenibacillus sp. FSL H8-0548 TaxID=1920422 RepID=UPI00096D59C1|nr:hypothetical protein [Paenibacillus sp. FSL H8-0548]OMF35225.1 hypothetical protein BK133_10965 [Paenibacillus sp. FSL H8-0548]